MKWNRWRIAAMLAVVLVVVALSGCPGTDVLTTGNTAVVFEVLLEGTTDQTYDCILWQFSGFTIRPLDGACVGGNNPGAPCFDFTDCDQGTCEGSLASEIVGDSGIQVTTGQKGNLLGVPCEPVDAGGVCDLPFPQPICGSDADCDPVAFPGNTCGAGGFCNLPFFPQVACSSDDDCTSISFPGNTCGEHPFEGLVDVNEFVPPTPVVLSSGLYEIGSLRAGQVGLYIDDTVPFLGQCEQFLAVDDFYALDDLRFEVGASGSGVIRFVLDVDVMEDVLTDPGNDPAGGNSCTAFKDNLLSIMRIEEDT